MHANPRHFLRLADATKTELAEIIALAIRAKQHPQPETSEIAKHKTLALIFDKPSTRTRVSFSVGFSQLGGTSMFFSNQELQLGRGEPLEDTARVISDMVDLVVLRTGAHNRVERFANHSSVPVINGLTDALHPCQLLADIMTYIELRGSIEGKRVAFIGDGSNNICSSYREAATIFGFELVVASPPGYQPKQPCHVTTDPIEAAHKANLIVTDVWVSMGDEEEKKARLKTLSPYQVTSSILDAGDNPVFLHCLPAHRGEEIEENLLEDPRSAVWQASNNRLHVQKRLMEFLLLQAQKHV